MHLLRPLTLPLVLAAFTLHAQQATVATGGDASGAGGSISYTIGQPAYTTINGPSASVAQGVQQPYEISMSTGMDDTGAAIALSAWPNPTTDALELSIGADAPTGLHYQLHDAGGKLLGTARITGDRAHIPMGGIAPGLYFLGVHGHDGPLRTFRIVKH